jgi:hypothetical protein
VLEPLQKKYGAAATTQEFDEERMRNRRYIWRRGDEEMSLLCFSARRPAFAASELTISRSRP